METTVNSVSGPDRNGNYQAKMSDGSTITFGPCKDFAFKAKGYWFVSLDGKPHSTFILDVNEGYGQVIRYIRASNATEREMWTRFAVRVMQSLAQA